MEGETVTASDGGAAKSQQTRQDLGWELGLLPSEVTLNSVHAVMCICHVCICMCVYVCVRIHSSSLVWRIS